MKTIFSGILLLLFSASSLATGMVPETSLLIIYEQEGGASMDVTNTDMHPGLLYTTLKDVDGDSLKGGVIVTQPVVRVEANKTQRVRFVLNNKTPLQVEHYKRVIFTNIPTKEKNKVKINFAQDLPVIIHPKDLPIVTDPWKKLDWKITNGKLQVKNDSAYVVRLSPNVTLLPSNIPAMLPQRWILPGQLLVATSQQTIKPTELQVKISPASRYGHDMETFTADLKK